MPDNGDNTVSTDDLTDAELFTLHYLRAVRDMAIATREGRDPNREPHWIDFRAKFAATFRVVFSEAPDALWFPLYRKGIDGLRDRGLVSKLQKDPRTLLWVPGIIFWDRIQESASEFKLV